MAQVLSMKHLHFDAPGKYHKENDMHLVEGLQNNKAGKNEIFVLSSKLSVSYYHNQRRS